MSNQIIAQNDNIHTSFQLNIDNNQRLIQETTFSFTAIALKSREIDDFSKIGFIYMSDTIYFSNDLHSNENSEYFYSSLIHFDEALKSIELFSQDKIDELEVVLINGSGNYSDFSQRQNQSIQNINCELNGVIQQSEWRAGLPEPSYNRVFTTTENMIVHHSAGSNNISDFTQAVRDIYIYHTEENGWSDIGYNYLVAPDGVVYAGRDPADGKQDEVMGAHFCGSNSNTMGVCLMGNYETVEPTSIMIESLEKVLSWKAFTDELNVLESNTHPLNSNLGVIAGHRDGCSTACPGENVYKRLQDIRVKVDEQLSVCNGEEEEEEESPVVELEIDSILNQKIYPNPIKTDFSFSFNISQNKQDDLDYILVFNQEGKSIKWQNLYFYENKLEVKLPNTLKPGIYFLQTIFKDGEKKSQQFLIQ
ncbi:N-acetylmuramoyl-L-alanine amidase [Marivirga salinae]|uniref:N-acetylmuramoyl-L-alanine amidase n=1 Tax=Marivirga salinarum TaxID=3059078 RepID=A0AA49JGR5_9BACT|nr:N-acetylmuramoyl-L-alanine amidase [Marivirga sp. BDSF4-3]WKK75621.2 N-acetylmuramoyl-L-alanine amidase [Marivirga sp. BDSF4-3]